ncbi:BsuBI/PstI family type II restriction endonuclease [Undibacterium sp.]|uniref:BsuBI/PstI family type II restriction endonuclease n=1 Tax=Undibacterium sp. TaxID=1914977 RepID=UPI0027314034|nr:BsuBI/PstI family type II restriction endonuclease [Undibacterium sp.]MDP1977623.1 BsuBI/PstI family type II restriction endonuclease [Undibacterium sp.]
MNSLPALPSIDEIRERVNVIFPDNFPDRRILTGEMATKAYFVALYGGFTESAARFFRPSTIIRFSHEQATLVDDSARLTWLSTCQTPGHKPLGQQWYADNTREPLRDDLIRNRALPIGIIVKREGVAPTSPAPIYAISDDFATLLSPDLSGDALNEAILQWQEKALNPMTLKRMRLLARGVTEKQGQVSVTLPTTNKVLRLAAGEASIITRDVCQDLAIRLMKSPVVIHVSISDQKTFPELIGDAAAYGLEFNPSAELPDVVMVDVGSDQGKVAFIEVVHSDGPITEVRKNALLKIAADAGIPAARVLLITAFEDRSSSPFKKRISELAIGSKVWFRSEPDVLLSFDELLMAV